MTERISNDDWDLMKAHYIRELYGNLMNIPNSMVWNWI